MATLRLRDDLRATEIEEAGLKYFDVADPRSGATLRMYEHEWLLARRLDGAASYEEVAGWAAGHRRCDAWGFSPAGAVRQYRPDGLP